tara:strand:- start:476 stop:1201 length:726 start_codon:yes stop_codon:yes gene_type:complete
VLIKKLINLFINKNKLYSNPNKHAPKPNIKALKDGFKVTGYQEFEINQKNIKPISTSYDLENKDAILCNYFSKDKLNKKTFLDLGAACGYFTFLALINGCKHATAIDIDRKHLEIIDKIARTYNINNLTTSSCNISEYKGSADIVNALSIIHWIYSCTSIFGNMENMIKFFQNITNEILFIEWIDPSDEAIQYFKHLDYNNSRTDDSYNYDSFVTELNKYFSSVSIIGNTRSTRKIFKAIK